MKVVTNIRRADLLRLNLYLLPRARSNLIFVAVLSALIFVYLLVSRKPHTATSILLAFVSALLGGIAALLVGFLISTTFILLASNKKSGILGQHTYTISVEGIYESTSANEGLQKWVGVCAVRRSSGFIFIQINSYLFHVLPRRAFSSQEEYDCFWNQAQKFWAQAAQQTVPEDALKQRASER